MNVTRFLLPLLLLSASALPAQDVFAAPPGSVGVPYSFGYSDVFGLSQIQSIDGLEFSYTFSVASGTPAPGLTLATNGLLSGIPTAPGNFAFTLRLTLVLRLNGVDVCPQLPRCVYDFPAAVQITGTAGPSFLLLGDSLSFTAVQGGSAPAPQSVTLSNRSGEAISFTTQTTYLNGANWLQLSATSGPIAAFSDSSITFTTSITGLAPGSYRARVLVTPAGSPPVTIFVTLTISSGQPSIILSQRGLFFDAVQNGTGVPAQTVTVLNSASGGLTYTATPLTFSGGSAWLTSTVNGSTLEVRVNPGSLAPGPYYGQISIAAQGVSNSPQIITVAMLVNPSTSLGAKVSPSGLVFVGRPGGSNPAAQTITVANYGRAAIRVGATINYLGGSRTFLTFSPSTANINAGASATISIRPNLTNVPAGIYRAEVAIVVDGTASAVFRTDVLLIVATNAGPAAQKEPSATGCTPTRLLPVFTALGAAFKVSAGWPTPIEVRVVDDCGDPLTGGSVSVSFSSGDAALNLVSLRDGRWSTTWQPRTSSTNVAITAKAVLESPKLSGTAVIGGQAAENPTVPIIGATVSAASFEKDAPIAPGAFVALFGNKVGGSLSVAPSLPLATTLDGVQVIVAGRPIPLYFTSEGQINAIVPYDIPVNTTQQVIVRKGSTLSVPEPVNIAVAQPALFTLDQSGKGVGIVVAYRGDRSWVVSANDPVRAGDVLVIYCTGLGPVTGNVTAGTAAPGLSGDQPASTSNTVTVTIGGRQTPVAFAGLTPGFAGLYQINTSVPEGVAPGAAELVLTVGGISSPAGTTIPVQ